MGQCGCEDRPTSGTGSVYFNILSLLLATHTLPFPSIPRGADRLNHIFISCPLSVRALPAIDRLHCQITATRGQLTGISVCPPVIVLWLILHLIMAINQPVNISDYSHLHRGKSGEKKETEGNK